MPKLTTVFDYSGTLSLEAVAFGGSEILKRQLHLSGLAEFGVDSPELFWDTIVNPTWEEGSLSPIGYRRLIVNRISAGWTVNRKEASLVALDQAAGMFTAAYFSHSRIDTSWRPLLEELYNNRLITAVVATDHYAEATEAISGRFQDIRMKAVSLSAGAAEREGCFLIANSADLGCRKDGKEFWFQVREQTGWEPGGRVLLVDDFGANEVGGDHYGQEERVARRRQRTTDLMTEVFAGPVEVVPFVLARDETSREKETHLLIAQVAVKVRNLLQEGDRSHV